MEIFQKKEAAKNLKLNSGAAYVVCNAIHKKFTLNFNIFLNKILLKNRPK